MLTPDILLVSPEKNPETCSVFEYLKQEHPKISTYVWDTSVFTEHRMCNLQFNNDNLVLQMPFSSEISKEEDSISLENVRSVWWWRPCPLKISSAIEEEEHVFFAYTEWTQAFEGLWYVMDCLWINHPERQEVALNHLYQLQAARSVGFNVLDTLITNSVKELSDFCKKHQGNVMYRPLVPFSSSCEILTEDQMQHLNNLILAPSMFQEIVNFKRHLNIIYMAGFLVATEVIENNNENSFQKFDIPRDLELKLQKMMKEMGLLYAELDIGIDAQNNPVFLSIDPCGSFLDIEKQTKIPLSQQLGQLLVFGKTSVIQRIWPIMPAPNKPKPSENAQKESL